MCTFTVKRFFRLTVVKVSAACIYCFPALTFCDLFYPDVAPPWFATIQKNNDDQLKTFLDKVTELNAALGGKVDKLSDKFDGMKGQVDAMRDQVNAMKGQVGAMKTQVDLLSGNVNTLREKVDVLVDKVNIVCRQSAAVRS
jgi:outer membrane murein-binding lipoprotein Lpp